VLFLGSTIGNFEHPADVKFLRQVRHILQSGDALLLGTDLLKPLPQLLEAYDDPLGVTAAFNLNLLSRMNRELHADFALEHFEHVARFNPDVSSVEMHIRSLKKQIVSIPAADLSVTLLEGETIWTESSHKYSLAEVSRIASEAGFRSDAQWIDEEWPFAENLLIAV
jgi:L-histidine N-alpha-methyltransferase